MILGEALLQLFPNADFRVDIILSDDGEGDYIKAWNLPQPQPTPAELEAAWIAWQAGEPARAAKAAEVAQAPLTAKAYFLANPAAVAFVRLSPAEQAAQIDAMTLAQLKTVVKYLAVAVSALVKHEFI